MKKSMILAAAAALVLCACAKVETVKNEAPEAVGFGVYAGANATKATYGDITTDNLKTSTDGFGVFAYYTEDVAWATAGATTKPNFMYNQQVYYNDGANSTLYPSKWYYTPLKYWPNGQNEDTVDAGTITDKLSFFAYAPHIATVNTVPAAGQGITAMSANTATGAPTLTFTVPAKAEEQIDLLWATPMLNQTKQTLTGTVDFTFHHALAKLNVQVQAVVDAVSATTSVLPSSTKIVLQSLELKADGTKTGTLSLADGTWTNKSGETDVTYTSASFAPAAKVVTVGPTNNQKTGFNVTETATDLNSAISPMIVPGEVATGKYVVIANYWVLTEDAALDGGYSVVQQVIKKASAAAITFAGGYKYNVVVKLGLTNVSFDVTEVEAWTPGADNSVDLPINTES